MLSYLVARVGVPLMLLKVHRNFDHDFQGDSVHPSILEALNALGLASPFHALPYAKMRVMRIRTAAGAWDWPTTAGPARSTRTP